jgi:hypothetical protein
MNTTMLTRRFICCAIALLGLGMSAVASADYNSCVAVCHNEYVACIRGHGGEWVCSANQNRCFRSCMTIDPTP